jgi:enamine deaminase RidA (YjgF/YER057c/UK114 family)
MERQNYASGTKWEPIVGYSRAVKVGNLVFIAGTTATDDQGAVIGIGDAYAQTAFILQKIERSLQAVGAELRHVVRTRLFITSTFFWEEVARAHQEVFGEIRPVATMVEVSALIGPEYLIEIEVDAVIHDAS